MWGEGGTGGGGERDVGCGGKEGQVRVVRGTSGVGTREGRGVYG